jgi:hypothetical protein
MAGLAAKIRARSAEAFRGRQCVVLYSHDLSHIPVIEGPDECVLRQISTEEIDCVEQIWKHDLNELRGRLAAGGRCYITWMQDRPAHYSWVQSSGVHRVHDAGRKFMIQEGDFWIYHCRTANWARGRRLYPMALSKILRDYRGAGFRRAWIYTMSDNVPSQKGIESVGFTLSNQLRGFHFAGLTVPL